MRKNLQCHQRSWEKMTNESLIYMKSSSQTYTATWTTQVTKTQSINHSLSILHFISKLCKIQKMESTALCGSRGLLFVYSSTKAAAITDINPSPLLIKSMATQKPLPSAAKTVSSRKQGPRSSPLATSPPIKLLTRVEQLKLLTKAEKAGLLSAAEKFGFSLSTIEKLGLLSKAEELGVLSAATDPGTPGALLSLSLGLLLLGPSCVYLVPEDYPWEVALQVTVVLLCVVGGSAAFAASNFVSNLQKSK
ncbi:unnamed protein product [Dovyalis caffra]|uniref:Uncharacterized protein n=1 Tax=Dovyalis caffra TaxID=77055 RepID=A0AAV1QNQ1_9ROSI|nr:unnamed protein product [Dovyalis caffra]